MVLTLLLFGLLGLDLDHDAADAPDIPVLAWQPRSDWLNVRTDGALKAVGDGIVDDTAAIQAALDQGGDARTVYLPAGTYRITRTLALTGPAVGCLVVGHGRDTRLVWDGPPGGTMFRSNGAAYSRFVGLAWDGRGRAAVGFDHRSERRFETEVRHEHESYRNFTGFGIRIGHEQKIASAEIYYRNCLFEACGTGVAMLAFNDYDNTFDRCEFRRCGTGISDDHGNFYARNCHFEGSRETDFFIHSEHGDSVRRCTSVGSRRFLVEGGTIAPLTVQDCHVAAWTDPDGAVVLDGSPVLMFDCVFSEPPSARPPVRLARSDQRILISQNVPLETEQLLAGSPQAVVTVVPPGKGQGVIRSARQRFLRPTAAVPARVLDARRDFGAKGDGRTDDTAAIQATIDAARQAGGGALAYLPAGSYVVSRSLSLRGGPCRLGGSGLRSGLVWRGPDGAPLLDVVGPDQTVIEHLAVGHGDLGPMTHGDDVRISADAGRPCSIALDEVYAYGLYRKEPDRHGIHLVALPKGSVVDGVHVQGNLRIDDCAAATLLFRTSYEGTATVAGASTDRGGLLGFLTRLDTIAGPTLHVRDNQSVVASDFYDEQSDSLLLLEGRAGAPPGAVTIQGAKTHLTTQQPVIQLRDFNGRVFYGQNQFYLEPKAPRIVATGDAPAQVVLSGCFFYQSRPEFDLSPATRLTLLGNIGVEDAGGDAQALAVYAKALDDLRRLGEADQRVDGEH